MLRCLIVLLAFIGVLCCRQAFAAEPGSRPASGPASEPDLARNLVSDPGFEEPGKAVWLLNNWYTGPNGEKNVAEAAMDTDNPHSGKYCQRITIKKHIGMDVQFQHKLPPVKVGDALEFRFWTRGTSNTTPAKVWILQHSGPYDKYMMGTVNFHEEWTETVCRMVVPPGAAVNDMAIWFSANEDGTFWLDDVSLTQMPVVEGGEPLKGNQVANGSFEVGRDKWYGCTGSSSGWENWVDAVEKSITMNLEAAETPDCPQGRKALHVKTPKICSFEVTSARFPLRYGHPATVSFWVKSSPKFASLGCMLSCGEYFDRAMQGQVSVNTRDEQWHRYTFTCTPKPSADSRYYLQFPIVGSCAPEIWLDGVTVTEGDAAPEVSAADFQAAGWETVDDSHAGNIYYPDEKVSFRILACGKPGQGEAALSGRIIDVWDHAVAPLDVKVPLGADGSGQMTLNVPASDKLGSFKIMLFSPGQDRMPAVEVVYHVVPRLKPLKEVKDSFFGGHFELTPYNLSIAEKAGFRWLRYHAPVDTKWIVVQPEPGPFIFHMEGTKRAHDMGFKIFGTFGKVPFWAEDRPPGGKKPIGGGLSSYGPRNLDEWDKYVVETAKAFQPYITTWEVWNEPDCEFLKVAPGDDSWILNNWFTGPNGEKNEYETALDADNPHSGKFCQRITLKKHAGRDIQFVQRLAGVKTGDELELRFWIRGSAGAKPITAMILTYGDPYTKFLKEDVPCTEAWREVVLKATIPADAPVEKLGLMFSISDAGTIWLDDVSLRAAKAADGGEPKGLIANGSFEIAPARSKEEIYMTIARRTRAALEKANLDVTLVGSALVSAARTFSKNILQEKVTEQFDVFSVHSYGAGNLMSVLTEMPKWKDFKDRKGRPIPYWQTEGQLLAPGIHSWLKTSGNVLTDPVLMARDAAGTTQMLAIVRAVGFAKNFHYLADAHPAGRLVYRNEWYSMIDVNGIPYSPLSAHAAAVLFLEDVQPAGYGKVPAGDATLSVCKFTRDGKRLEVIWSSSPISVAKVIEAAGLAGARVFDMMGNPVTVDASTMLTYCPMYFQQ